VRRTYQAWEDPEDGSITLAPSEVIADERQRGLLSARASCLYELVAETHEEAAAVHALRMGWEPFRPVGEPAPCPRCAAIFYPSGSGQCWRCGDPREP
jgi:hypothetical protein